MTIRNCYAVIGADGRTGTVHAGPASKDGGMVVIIKTREHGDISADRVEVRHWVSSDGKVIIRTIVAGGVELERKEFIR